jgi:hypothetical protein
VIASISITRSRLTHTVVLVGALGLFGATSQAGEKIQFSDRSTKVDLPVKGPEDLKPSTLQNFLSSRRSELGAPDIFSFAAPRNARNPRDKREQERLEEKKYWIMQNAESLRGEKPTKTPDDKESGDESDKETKPLTLMERFSAERDRKSQGNTNQFRNGFQSEVRSLDFANRQNGSSTNRAALLSEGRNNSMDSAGATEAARSSARLPATARNGEAEVPKSNGVGPTGLSFLERTERLRQQEERTAELQRLLDSPGSVSAAPRRGVELLNTPDATRQEINPVFGRGLNEGAARLDLKTSLDPRGSSSRPSILNELVPSGFGSPGGGPALLIPKEPVRIERRPAVLELPKRRI